MSQQAWKELGLDTNTLDSKELTERKVSLFGKDIQEFAAAVVGDDHERLGTLVYGLSNDRMRQVVYAARERSRRALLDALGAIAALGLCTFLLGTLMANGAAAQRAAPIVKLTSAASGCRRATRHSSPHS